MKVLVFPCLLAIAIFTGPPKTDAGQPTNAPAVRTTAAATGPVGPAAAATVNPTNNPSRLAIRPELAEQEQLINQENQVL